MRKLKIGNMRSFARDDWWLHESNKYKPVSAEEEASLSRDKLIEHNLRFAISVAKQYAYTNIPIEDLIQYANIGKRSRAGKSTLGRRYIKHTGMLSGKWIGKTTHIFTTHAGQTTSSNSLRTICITARANAGDSSSSWSFLKKPCLPQRSVSSTLKETDNTGKSC